jgi:hypothetical protein
VSDRPQWHGREVPWRARNQADREAMTGWVHEQLNIRREIICDSKPHADISFRDLNYQLALVAAWGGNMQPLRALKPDLAPFLHPPKRGRGEYRRRRGPDYVPPGFFQLVKEEMKYVDHLWKKYFGRTRRNRLDGPSKLDILKARYELTEKEISKLEKPSGRRKPAP